MAGLAFRIPARTATFRAARSTHVDLLVGSGSDPCGVQLAHVAGDLLVRDGAGGRAPPARQQMRPQDLLVARGGGGLDVDLELVPPEVDDLAEGARRSAGIDELALL